MTKISIVAAAAMLAGGIGVAAAQTSTTPSTPSAAAQGKCWDAVTNQVRDRTPQMGASGTTGTTGTTGGMTGSTTGNSGTAGTTTGGGTAGSLAQDRPPGAVGLPNC
jgi:hypothetical protein